MIGNLLLLIFFIVIFPSGLFSQEEDNPHKEMVTDQFICLDCHTKVPEKGETDPKYFLFDLPSEVCLGCHDEYRHGGIIQHMDKKAGKDLPGDENGKIACFTCHDPHPQGVIEGRVVYNAETNPQTVEFEKQIVIPSLQKSLGLKKESQVYLKDNKEVYLRQPVGQLCLTCHDQDKIYKSNWREHILWDKYPGSFSR